MPSAAAEWRSSTVRWRSCVKAQVVHAHIHETRLARPTHDPMLWTSKKLGKIGGDVKLHGRTV